MAKIYFNRPIIKHLEETTVINFFFQKDGGDSIYIRDLRPNTYRNNKVIFGEVDLYRQPLDEKAWNLDITPMKIMSNDMYGIYTGEGVDFEIRSDKQPIFVIRQKELELSLATVGYMPQGGEVPEVALGMFHIGTEIRFRRNGIPAIDKLTKKGWKRIMGPDDYKFGIITVEDAFEEKLKREEDLKDPAKKKDMEEEGLQRIRDAKSHHDIHPELADNLISYKTDEKEDMTYYFLASDVKDLISQGIIL